MQAHIRLVFQLLMSPVESHRGCTLLMSLVSYLTDLQTAYPSDRPSDRQSVQPTKPRSSAPLLQTWWRPAVAEAKESQSDLVPVRAMSGGWEGCV